MERILTAAEITDTAQELLDWLDADTFPQSRSACDWIIQSNGEAEMAQKYADLLAASDGRQELPNRVDDFIIALYETEITRTESSTAMLNLGAFYYTGRCREPDYEKALEYYRMAADRGEIIALENIGYCYYYGRSVEVDYERAYYWFSQAAMHGRPTALYKIGDMYRNGYVLPKNGELAFAVYRRSLACMDGDSAVTAAGPVLLRLGDCHLTGIGTEPDARLARNCYQAAEQYLYDMVDAGDNNYRSSLKRAIEGQEAARQLLREVLG